MPNPYRPPEASPAPGNAVQPVAPWLLALNAIYLVGVLAAFLSALPEGLGPRAVLLLVGFASPFLVLVASYMIGFAKIFAISCALLLSIGAMLFLSHELAMRGGISIAPLLVASVPIWLVGVNLLGSRPNNSSKPTPLRGAA